MKTIQCRRAASAGFLTLALALVAACTNTSTDDVGGADEARDPNAPSPSPSAPSRPAEPAAPVGRASGERLLRLSFSDLPALANGFTYEGWAIVDGRAISTGKLPAGALTTATSALAMDVADRATAFVLTIEPANDVDPGPTKTHVLAGSIVKGRADLSIAAKEAIGSDFATATGTFILATPTDGKMTNETSGVWFLVPPPTVMGMPQGMPMPSLELVPLPTGWTYEGWAVVDGKPLSTGKFAMTSGADRAAPFSSSKAPGPPFPGEDFLVNAPSPVLFPTDLRGKEIVITVEPEPDDSPMPYALKPLAGTAPADAMSGMSLPLMNTSSKQPRGAAVIEEATSPQ